MTRSDTFIKLAGDAADGTYASLAGVPLEKMAAGNDFAQRYEARFKKSPGVYAPYAYDGAWNMIPAIEQADSADPSHYLHKLAPLDRPGTHTSHTAPVQKGHLTAITVTNYQYHNSTQEMSTNQKKKT